VNIPLRKIIHCDCDCFYAAVEMRDNPALRGIPLAVGGSATQRGVIATCNYEAREYGVRSAMPTAQALLRCPHLTVLPPAMEKYREASQLITAIYRDYTDLVEPLSLDEAYLDVTHSTQHQGSGTRIAQEIRARIEQTVGITASAGVAPNKFLAKIASDWHKPNGLFVIRPTDVAAFVETLPIAKVFGVGKVTAAKLHSMGVTTCLDLQAWSLFDLEKQFGKFGQRLYELCRGIDHREVSANRERKSVSIEETYTFDLPDLTACLAELPGLIATLQRRIERAQANAAIHKLFVKIRFSDFRHTTAECLSTQVNHETLQQLMATAYERGQLPVRLLGIGIRLRHENESQQADLFEQLS
jgi:DNA polymerase-4